MTRVLLVCPGRGSYDRSALGQLQDRAPAVEAILDLCDAWRTAHGRPTIRSLDAAGRHQAARHVAGEHASLLTAACTWADHADLDTDRYEVVGVVGNSMGFYSALAVSGALSLSDAIRLVDTMGAYQAGNVRGGQILYPIAGPDWRPDPALRATVEDALASSGGTAFWSIDLGNTAVLGGTDEGVAHLLAALPPLERGPRTFPLRLPLHSAFHTPVMAETARTARRDLAGLSVRAPRIPLVDGRGFVHRPRWADPDALLDYTLGTQVTEPFDFTTALRTALRHTGATCVVLLGPGNSLGGPVASILVTEGWRGARTRARFEALQASDAPVLLSMGVPEQRARLVR